MCHQRESVTLRPRFVMKLSNQAKQMEMKGQPCLATRLWRGEEGEMGREGEGQPSTKLKQKERAYIAKD
jgi:hypothetical protein